MALARIETLDRRVTELASRPNGSPADGADPYEPVPAPAWWKLTGDARREPVTQLRAWVEQVYRPGYGHLAATLGTCWPRHDLCLYALDIAAQLWTALYLQPERDTPLLSAQAEYQVRILPALAAQLETETTGCGHNPTRPAYPGNTP